MTQFRQITDQFWAAGQITAADVASLADQGVTLIINNRPDGEAPGQPTAAEIGAAAANHNIAYIHLPVAGGISMDNVITAADAINETTGVTLGFCAGGMRATAIYAFARASKGEDADTIIAAAANAGFDLAAQRPALEALAKSATA